MKAVNVNDVLKIIHKYGTFIFVTDNKKYSDMEYEIANLPPVQLEREKGEWIKTPKAVMGEGFSWYCSKCQKEVYQDTSRNYPSENFCPRCGADMRGEKNE